MAKKAKKKVAAKRAAKTAKSNGPRLLDYFAAHANIPWDHVALALKVTGVTQSDPAWEAAAAEQSARLSYLWADAMVNEAGRDGE